VGSAGDLHALTDIKGRIEDELGRAREGEEAQSGHWAEL
jgi:hypothetical protein